MLWTEPLLWTARPGVSQGYFGQGGPAAAHGFHDAPDALVVGRRFTCLFGPATQEGVYAAVVAGRQRRDDGLDLLQQFTLRC